MMPATTVDNINNWFRYHPPTTEQIVKYADLREAGRVMALAILEHCPASADQTAALRKLREAFMTANAAIACAPAPREPEKEPLWPCSADCGSVLPQSQMKQAGYTGAYNPPLCPSCLAKLRNPKTRIATLVKQRSAADRREAAMYEEPNRYRNANPPPPLE
jgi:hypothetical protein